MHYVKKQVKFKILILLHATAFDGIYGVINTGVEILITHIQIFNAVFNQQPCLIPDQINKKSFLGQKF